MTHLDQLVCWQLQHGWQVRILVPSVHRHEVEKYPAVHALAEYYSYPQRGLMSLLRFGYACRRALRRYQPDIVHIHGTIAGVIARMVLRVYQGDRIPALYCAHGWYFSGQFHSVARFCAGLVERVLSWRSDAVIAISEAERERALTYRIPRGNLLVVRHGVAAREIKPQVSDSPPIVIGYVGRFDRQKGYDLILNAIEKVDRPDLRFEFIGNSVLDEDVHRKADKHIQYHGWLPQPEAVQIVAACHVTLCFSRWEGFGYVVPEALSCGTPCIVSSIPSLTEHIVDGENGYVVEAESIEGLALCLENLNLQKLLMMRQNAVRSWMKNYQLESMLRKYDVIYGWAIRRHRQVKATG